ELCLSGYIFHDKGELRKVSFSKDSDLFAEITAKIRKTNKTVIFGFSELSGDKIYNSAAIVIPNDTETYIYRKTHLFFKEKFVFTAGDTGFFVVEDKQNNCKIGTMLCYDWRFPESARSLALNGADLIVCPSNLVTDLWQKVMPARAIENKVYLAVANRTGEEESNREKLLFKGESGIWDYAGNLLAEASFEGEEVIYADIEPEMTRKKSFNEFNDIFADRRPELYAK
ncbi:MAG: nitrilase-related carbon-nitrogen hydrolase, partial [Ignavibacteria bacterium]|nr:nitrilase-related carbon-nitrogen hydrolase [Ignavibacteria bacterium]